MADTILDSVRRERPADLSAKSRARTCAHDAAESAFRE
jgi:hypothetical protein